MESTLKLSSHFHKTPTTLYDTCIKTIVKHINLIIDSQKTYLSWNNYYYELNDSIQLTSSIYESILNEYSLYNEDKLRESNLNYYFKISITSNGAETLGYDTSLSHQIQYHTILMSICRKSTIEKLIYRECCKLSFKSKVPQLLYNYTPKTNHIHLDDFELNEIIKYQFQSIKHIDICVCKLTNRSIRILNKLQSSKNLKYLSLSNHCMLQKVDLFLDDSSNKTHKKRTCEQQQQQQQSDSVNDDEEAPLSVIKNILSSKLTRLQSNLRLKEKRLKISNEDRNNCENESETNDDDESYLNYEQLQDVSTYHQLQLPQIQYLILKNLNGLLNGEHLNAILSHLIQLKYLDLTNTCNDIQLNENNERIQHTLTHLVYSNNSCASLELNLNFICKLKQLKHLDLSYYLDTNRQVQIQLYTNASYLLAKLLFSLSNLLWLDISGTNLSGPELFNKQDEIKYINDKFKEENLVSDDVLMTHPYNHSSIIGLMFLKNKLQFLGCFNCDDVCGQRDGLDLMAKRVASDTCEEYLLNSLIQYQEREYFSFLIINQMFELYRDDEISTCNKLHVANLIMNTMHKYLHNSRLQISGSACLFYVLKNAKDENVPLPFHFLRRLIETIVNSIEEHIDQSAMKRNCVLIMCRLFLPEDILFISNRLIKILLKIINDFVEQEKSRTQSDPPPRSTSPETFVIRTSMHLLNILACSTSIHGEKRHEFGVLAIPCIMKLIKLKIAKKEIDDVLEVTWSFLWNITDETPTNCQIFLDKCKGMSVFLDCVQFRPEIVRNIMGLLGNIAECKELRSHLVTKEYIQTYRTLLRNDRDGIEIAYNSAGVLVHILSDGETFYASEIDINERQEIILELESTIDSWNINYERNINYRSFGPIFALVRQNHTPICQRWACWALANLTTVYPDNYCALLIKENGVELLENLVNSETINDINKKYAQMTLNNVKNHFNSEKSIVPSSASALF